MAGQLWRMIIVAKLGIERITPSIRKPLSMETWMPRLLARCARKNLMALKSPIQHKPLTTSGMQFKPEYLII